MVDALHLVCGLCNAVNRIPNAKMHQQPVCGKCKHALFDGQPIKLSNANFEVHLQHTHIPLLVDFWAPWCGPCLSMAPAFEQAAARLAPNIRVAKLDTEAEPALAQRYQIRSIPTLALFHQGRELARQAGAMDLNGILRWASQHAPIAQS